MTLLQMFKRLETYICVSLVFLTASCGQIEQAFAPISEQAVPLSTPLPSPTFTPTLEPTPTPEATFTPEPTVAPDVAFAQWLADNRYEFLVTVTDGSLRHKRPETGRVSVDVYPSSVLVMFNDLGGKNEFALAMLEATEVIIGAIESYGLDPVPLRDALSKPHNLPFIIQGEKYIVTAETGLIVTYRVSFSD